MLDEKSESEMKKDVMLLLAGWIQDYIKHLDKELALRRQRINSPFTIHHINGWAESTLKFLSQSYSFPCPSCGELIPLNLDMKVITDAIKSLLREIHKAQDVNVDSIRNRLVKVEGEHQVQCKDHNKDCPIGKKGWVSLSQLLSS